MDGTLTNYKSGSKPRFGKFLGRYTFFLPAVALMLVFFLFPIVLTVYYSFTNCALTGPGAMNTQFVGLSNYIQMFQDPVVFISIMNTLIFLLFSSLIGQQVLEFIIALLMKNKNKNFRRVIGIFVLAGWVTPEIIVAFCMMSFFANDGTLNAILGLFHIAPIAWLYKYSLFAVIIANAWHGTAYSMLMFQAALDDVPKEIEEAAIVDGATRWQLLTKIILPYIKGAITTNTMLNTLQTLGVFGLIYTMTGGGPSTSSTTLPIYMYNSAFVNYQIGYGTAISMILLAIGIILSLIYVKAAKKYA